jgi:hypothetical protein
MRFGIDCPSYHFERFDNVNTNPMEITRIISPSDVRLYYFGSKDVLVSPYDKENRKKKLQRAAVLTHNKSTTINIYLKLPNGEMVETQSDSFDFIGDFVIIKGGFAIPVWAVVDIDA